MTAVRKAAIPLGVRTNNPLNIMGGHIPWDGKTGVHRNAAGEYVVFDRPESGVRAAALDVLNDWQRKGRDTIRLLLEEFAPTAHGNNVDAYARAVSKRMGIDPDERLNLADKAVLVELLWAMSWHELGGNPETWGLTRAQFEEGARLALERRRLIPAPQKVADAAAATGVAGAGVTEALQSAASALQPIAPMLEFAQWAFIALTLAGVAYTLYRHWRA